MNKNPNVLASLDPIQLKVFQDMAVFEQKREPLEEDLCISGLGGSKKEALIVSVPALASFLDTSSELQQLGEIRAGILEQMVVFGRRYVRESENQISLIRELGELNVRKKARDTQRPDRRPDFHLLTPQQQLEERQRYERLNFEIQQDNKIRMQLNDEMVQQASRLSQALKITKELDSFFDLISHRMKHLRWFVPTPITILSSPYC